MSISRNWLYAIGTFVIAFILGTMLVLPIFDDRRGIDILLGVGKEEPVEPLGADDWLGISSAELDSSSDGASQTLQDALDGTNRWIRLVGEVHWFVLDLGQTYDISKVRSRSNYLDDPTDVNIYIDDSNPPTTLCHEGITTWQDTDEWVEITLDTPGTGRYIKVEVENTEDVINRLQWGASGSPYFTIFDAYGDVAAAPPSNNAPYQTGEVPANASTGISLAPSLYVKCVDNDSTDEMNATWWSNSTGSWACFATNETSFANNTNITQINTNFSSENTKYYWSVNLSDGTDWTNNTYHFTTKTLTWHIFDSTINGSIYNVSRWNIFDSTINGSIYNASKWYILDSTINGSIYNLTSWKTIDNAINGSIYNTSNWYVIDNTINGSIYNISRWNIIDNTINGSIYNSTTWKTIDNTINGSIYNVSKWNVIDSTINGSIYNVSKWSVIDNTINGSIYNLTNWKTINNTINGSIYNTSRWKVIDSTINGSIYNVSRWKVIDNTINGSIYNLTLWKVIDATINGSIYNTSQWRIFDSTTNGSIYNTSKWNVIDNTINGSIYSVTVANITISSPYPTNGSTDVSLNTSLHITVNHTAGHSMNITFYTGSNLTNCSALLGSFNSVSNGTYYMGYHNASNLSTEYAWKVNASDGKGNYTQEVYNFTTVSTTGVSAYYPGRYTIGMVMALSMLFTTLFLIVGVLWKKNRKNSKGGYI